MCPAMPRAIPIFRLAPLAALFATTVAPGQVREVDPSSPDVAAARASQSDVDLPPSPPPTVARNDGAPAPLPTRDAATGEARTRLPTDDTFKEEEIFGAAEKTFGKGTQGLAKFMENLLRKQGRPTAYIAGRDAGGAIVVGLRYGQGTLFHKVEGEQPVYWQSPSVGFDIGGAGSKTFILVYNLYDSEELFKRFPQVEGNLYAVGGFTASYLRRGDIALVPIRLGVGWRFGASVGWMNFSHKGRAIP